MLSQKNILLSAALVCICKYLPAQNKSSKFFTQISFGPSFSTGKFADKRYASNFLESNPSGLAKTGMGLNLSVGYHLTNSTGIILMVGGSQNKQDPKSFETYLKNLYGNNLSISIKTHNWKIGKILAGVFFKVPVSNTGKLFFQPKIMLGVCQTAVPGFSYVVTDQISFTSYFKSKEHLALAFCYQAGTALQYNVSKSIYICFDLNFFAGSPVLKFNYNPNFPAPGPLSAHAKIKYHLASVNNLLSFGVNF